MLEPWSLSQPLRVRPQTPQRERYETWTMSQNIDCQPAQTLSFQPEQEAPHNLLPFQPEQEAPPHWTMSQPIRVRPQTLNQPSLRFDPWAQAAPFRQAASDRQWSMCHIRDVTPQAHNPISQPNVASPLKSGFSSPSLDELFPTALRGWMSRSPSRNSVRPTVEQGDFSHLNSADPSCEWMGSMGHNLSMPSDAPPSPRYPVPPCATPRRTLPYSGERNAAAGMQSPASTATISDAPRRRTLPYEAPNDTSAQFGGARETTLSPSSRCTGSAGQTAVASCVTLQDPRAQSAIQHSQHSHSQHPAIQHSQQSQSAIQHSQLTVLAEPEIKIPFVVVTNFEGDYASINGIYAQRELHCGRPTYVKLSENDSYWIYYQELAWFFGPSVGEEKVWALRRRSDFFPPYNNWSHFKKEGIGEECIERLVSRDANGPIVRVVHEWGRALAHLDPSEIRFTQETGIAHTEAFRKFCQARLRGDNPVVEQRTEPCNATSECCISGTSEIVDQQVPQVAASNELPRVPARPKPKPKAKIPPRKSVTATQFLALAAPKPARKAPPKAPQPKAKTKSRAVPKRRAADQASSSGGADLASSSRGPEQASSSGGADLASSSRGPEQASSSGGPEQASSSTTPANATSIAPQSRSDDAPESRSQSATRHQIEADRLLALELSSPFPRKRPRASIGLITIDSDDELPMPSSSKRKMKSEILSQRDASSNADARRVQSESLPESGAEIPDACKKCSALLPSDHNFCSKCGQPRNQDESIPSAQTCSICFENERNMVFLPCGHIACCNACAKRCKKTVCPFCRKKVTKIVRTYNV